MRKLWNSEAFSGSTTNSLSPLAGAASIPSEDIINTKLSAIRFNWFMFVAWRKLWRNKKLYECNLSRDFIDNFYGQRTSKLWVIKKLRESSSKAQTNMLHYSSIWSFIIAFTAQITDIYLSFQLYLLITIFPDSDMTVDEILNFVNLPRFIR